MEVNPLFSPCLQNSRDEDMAPEIRPVPRPEWTPLTAPGTENVEGKVLLILDNLTVAILRFAPEGHSPEVAAPYPTDVICLEGGGFTSVVGEEGELRAGYSVRWGADATRSLWTETETMTVLMVEHFRQS